MDANSMKIANLRPGRLLLILLMALPLKAQMLPDSPKPQLDASDWALLASDAGARALDTYSTRWALKNGNREMFLPGFVANHTSMMVAFSGSMVTLNYFAAKRMVRHRHFIMARILLSADSLEVYPWAIHNLMLPKCNR
jgi:hypothetical protein